MKKRRGGRCINQGREVTATSKRAAETGMDNKKVCGGNKKCTGCYNSTDDLSTDCDACYQVFCGGVASCTFVVATPVFYVVPHCFCGTFVRGKHISSWGDAFAVQEFVHFWRVDRLWECEGSCVTGLQYANAVPSFPVVRYSVVLSVDDFVMQCVLV